MENMKQFYKFLLVSKKSADSVRITQEIEKNKRYRVTGVESAVEATSAISKGGIDCLVFNFETFSLSKTKLVTDARNLGNKFPIIIFAALVQKEALEHVKKLGNVVIIEKPFESKDVWGICEKFVQGRKVNQRIFRRFFTDQSAAVEKTGSGETMNVNIYNLSVGGAYVELPSGGNIAAGDIINMTIHLDKVSREYKVDALVVWASPSGFWKGNPAAGLRFMKTNDVYRNLLDKL